MSNDEVGQFRSLSIQTPKKTRSGLFWKTIASFLGGCKNVFLQSDWRNRPLGEFFTVLPRKEVIHPQIPLRIPCYDLVLLTDPTFGPIKIGTSGVADSAHLTGGEYKARERIHRGVADPRLLAIPASWSRVADSNPN